MVNEDAALLNRRVTHMTPAALFSRRLQRRPNPTMNHWKPVRQPAMLKFAAGNTISTTDHSSRLTNMETSPLSSTWITSGLPNVTAKVESSPTES